MSLYLDKATRRAVRIETGDCLLFHRRGCAQVASVSEHARHDAGFTGH